jgi:hypothetical protein
MRRLEFFRRQLSRLAFLGPVSFRPAAEFLWDLKIGKKNQLRSEDVALGRCPILASSRNATQASSASELLQPAGG